MVYDETRGDDGDGTGEIPARVASPDKDGSDARGHDIYSSIGFGDSARGLEAGKGSLPVGLNPAIDTAHQEDSPENDLELALHPLGK